VFLLQIASTYISVYLSPRHAESFLGIARAVGQEPAGHLANTLGNRSPYPEASTSTARTARTARTAFIGGGKGI
jgi:hypothetical protein